MTVGRRREPGRRRSGRGDGLRRFVLPLALVLPGLAGCEFQPAPERHLPAQGPQARDLAREIEDMLHASAGSWNAGDLDGFLDDYWRSEELTFSGPGGVTRGWDDVRRRYLESHWAPGVERDSLRFEVTETVALGSSHALALGRYVLFRPGAGGAVSSSGHFSLVLRSLDGEWRIIHDHTSASPPEDTVREDVLPAGDHPGGEEEGLT
jgi:ketosteroid isomerase-like protein